MMMENSIYQGDWRGRNESVNWSTWMSIHVVFLLMFMMQAELIPWIRTFICRITDISISNKALETQFKEDLQAMYEMYGLKEEE